MTLNAYTTNPATSALGNGTTYTLSPTSYTGWEYVAATGDSKVYTFKITDLQAVDDSGNELHYYVTEGEVTGYTKSYATKDGDSIINGDKAINGQQIINTQEGSYALPSTGGVGTGIFTILGSILILGAGVLLWRRRRLI